LAIYNATDTSGTGSRGPRPNCGQQQVFGRQPSVAGGAFQGFQWMSPNGYSEPANGTFGNCPAQGPVTGPGYTDTDIGLLKSFHLTEAKYFEFRGDFLNTFNNVQLAAPSTTFPSSTFGLVSQSQPARNIQFALKFYY
jgi:hypothetical protein